MDFVKQCVGAGCWASEKTFPLFNQFINQTRHQPIRPQFPRHFRRFTNTVVICHHCEWVAHKVALKMELQFTVMMMMTATNNNVASQHSQRDCFLPISFMCSRERKRKREKIPLKMLL
jgi:hypothetical protein